MFFPYKYEWNTINFTQAQIKKNPRVDFLKHNQLGSFYVQYGQAVVLWGTVRSIYIPSKHSAEPHCHRVWNSEDYSQVEGFRCSCGDGLDTVLLSLAHFESRSSQRRVKYIHTSCPENFYQLISQWSVFLAAIQFYSSLGEFFFEVLPSIVKGVVLQVYNLCRGSWIPWQRMILTLSMVRLLMSYLVVSSLSRLARRIWCSC